MKISGSDRTKADIVHTVILSGYKGKCIPYNMFGFLIR